MRKIVLLSLLFTSCSITHYQHGIPNLVQVSPELWRGGQPEGDEGWKYLASLGVTDDVKLDFDEEGTDEPALSYGIIVHRLSVEPSTKAGFVESVVDVFALPDPATLAELLKIWQLQREARADATFMSPHKIYYVHCKNGHDRTGLAVGMYRVIVDGWDKHHAWAEMLDRGFHPELIGLDRAFHEFTPTKTTK